MNRPLKSVETVEILLFANTLKKKLEQGTCTTQTLAEFISVVKEILKTHEKE